MKVTALIPAYNPSHNLVALVRDLAAADFAAIIVVNDGSTRECDPVFAAIGAIDRAIVLEHSVNLGKGAALKTGLNHACCCFGDHIGVVTIDADGQHLVTDARQVAAALAAHPESLVVGARSFGKDVPWRSKFGNNLTKYLFRLLVGQKLTDTQSGLRGIPRSLVRSLLKIRANGYEFELDMLLACKYSGRHILEQPITTVYIGQNQSSHFNPVVDSMRIYFVLFRFTLASLFSALIDNVVFIAVFWFSADILVSQVVARSASVPCNFYIVKNVVYYSDLNTYKTFAKYLVLVFFSGFVSYLLIQGITRFMPFSVIPAKLIAETTVFFANFAIQRDFIFAADDGGVPVSPD